MFDEQGRTICVRRTNVTRFAWIDKPVAAFGQLARTRTTVAVRLIAVVTFFAGVKRPVATFRQLTDARAAIAVVHIAVVALFETVPDKPITTNRFGAVRTSIVDARIAVFAVFDRFDDSVSTTREGHVSHARTAVAVVRISVIALFDARPDKPIPTLCFEAVYASVVRIGIRVIALFARFDDAVSTGREGQFTRARTAVAVVRIAVVALFNARPDKPIPTLCFEAADARVVRIGIRVVTLFARVDDAVSTARKGHGTHAGASVAVLHIAVIALFERRPDKPVSAEGFLTLGAFIRRVEIAVVTLLGAKPHHAIAALSESTVETRIVAVRITVVALLEALHETVAAKPAASRRSTAGTRWKTTRSSGSPHVARATYTAPVAAYSSRRTIASGASRWIRGHEEVVQVRPAASNKYRRCRKAGQRNEGMTHGSLDSRRYCSKRKADGITI